MLNINLHLIIGESTKKRTLRELNSTELVSSATQEHIQYVQGKNRPDYPRSMGFHITRTSSQVGGAQI